MVSRSRNLLADDVFDDLLQKIETNQWKINELIPSENQLAKTYEVSRVSIRSALQRLQTLELIVTKPGKGSYVIANSIKDTSSNNPLSFEHMDLSEHEYRYIVELRNAIEFKSIDLMARYGTQDDLDHLQSALNAMKEGVHDITLYVNADYEFHMSIVQGSHNPIFVTVMEACKEHFIKYFTEMAKASSGQYEKPIENHTHIYEAMVRRDGEAAKEIILGTFEYNLSRFKKLFKDVKS
jgi:DNA-binding FadR family transcriptional regulator